ncbi:MAG TPA: VIT and VWA domain-containing protein [Saprospiraceae bacterium]|nr:VIT and VWA domain-containing protein [Saprospiraceae bacterium]
MKTIQFFLTTVLLLAVSTVFGQSENKTYKTEQPYFLIQSDNQEPVRLPLKGTSVKAKISGVIADVTVLQTYHNTGKKPIEARYVFPLSDKAAVYSMEMCLNTRHIVAQIRERDQARAAYEQARNEGKHASLLEQERPNVFTMSVANIMPNEIIEVEVKYTEYILPNEGVYSFIFPTTVGPRYNGNHAKFVSMPYLRSGNPGSASFDLSVDLFSSVPVSQLICSSHKTQLQKINDSHFSVSLCSDEINRANKDFTLDYVLKGSTISSGIQLYNHGDEQFFMAMIQPPKRVMLDEIPAREYVFVVDVSGSMNGFPLDVSKDLLKNLIAHLRASDYFNVVLFAGGSASMSPHSLPATRENVDKAIALIDGQSGGGGTELISALNTCMALPRPSVKLSRSVVLVTDGYITVEKEAISLIKKNLNQCNVFTFGIGNSVNHYLINSLAHVGGGEPFIVTNTEKANSIADKFRKYIQTPVLSNISVNFKGFEAYDLTYDKIPDVMGERPIIISGKYKGSPIGKMVVSGQTGKGSFEKSIFVAPHLVSKDFNALRYLWAREKIKIADDYGDGYNNQEQQAEKTQLGLKYNLLTAYTSFVAIDQKEIVNPGCKSDLTEQANVLPAGVSELAIGADFNMVGCFVAAAGSHYHKIVTIIVLGLLISVLIIMMYHALKQPIPPSENKSSK